MENFASETPLNSRESGSPFRNPLLSTKSLHALSEEKRRVIIEETALDAFDALSSAGFKSYGNNLQNLRRDVAVPELIVRRENPDLLLRAVQGKSLPITFPDRQRYSNAVVWDLTHEPESMNNAFLEGFGTANGVVLIAGMKPKSLDIVKLPDASQVFNGLDRRFVVSVQGTVPSVDIVFVIVRTPLHAFPLELMSESEIERLEDWKEKDSRGVRTPSYISRCFLNPLSSVQKLPN